MKKTMHKTEGFILVLTLMLLTIMTFIVSRFFLQGSIHVQLDSLLLERES